MRSVDWDVFISHASEDKDGFVRDLADELRRVGIRVWYDEFTLKAGDSLRESIDRGISGTHIGFVVISKNFFKKHWTRQELNGIASLAVAEDRKIIPIWLEITAEDVRQYSPILADRIAILASKGVAAVRDEILPIVWRESVRGFNRRFGIYTVEHDGVMRDVITVMPVDQAFVHGLPEEMILGALRQPVIAGPHFPLVTPGNFIEHRFFHDFLHKFLAREIYQNPTARESARIQRSGYFYLIDKRTEDPQGSVPPEDILGAVEISDGELVPGSYRRNFKHQLFTRSGFFLLADELEKNMISTLSRLVAQQSKRQS